MPKMARFQWGFWHAPRPPLTCIVPEVSVTTPAITLVSVNLPAPFAGQITGVFGLVGARPNRTSFTGAAMFSRDFFHGGEVILHGKPVRYRVPAPAVRDGIAYVTEDRKVEEFLRDDVGRP